MHQQMAAALDDVVGRHPRIQRERARDGVQASGPRWPMIVLRTPKGWTGPRRSTASSAKDYWRSHQVPMGDMDKPSTSRMLEHWMKSYRPEELFDATGRRAGARRAGAEGHRRMSANPHANGGLLLRDLRCPTSATTRSRSSRPARSTPRPRACMGKFLRDVMKLNLEQQQLPPLQPRREQLQPLAGRPRGDRTAATWREICPTTTTSRPTAASWRCSREHQCQGWLEGYLLTGRHGFFSCYEAFIHIVDSMFNQHAKWLKVCNHIPWRRPIASLNYLLSSHVWRQDHNGFIAPGSRLHRPRRQQEGGNRSASTCRPTPTPCCRSPTTACAAATTSTSSSPASSRRRSG